MAAVIALILAAMGLSAFHVVLYAGPISPKNQPDPGIFEGAVMIAAGKGFSLPVTLDANAPVKKFLACEIDTLRREDLRLGVFSGTLPAWDRCHRYLIGLIGWTWRLFGISWHVLWMPVALLYGITAGAVFGLFRLAMGRVLSVLGTLLVMSSPLMLSTSMSVRDFSKAPFFLLSLLIMGCLLGKPLRRPVFLALATALGTVLGLGLGFRQDLNICIPPAILAIALCWQGFPSRPGVVCKGLALALFLAGFLTTAWPILVTIFNESGAQSGHDVMMGLATQDSVDAGCERPAYELVYLSDDNLVHAVRARNHQRLHPGADPIRFDTPDAAVASYEYLWAVVRTFPADLVTRACATVRFVLSDPEMRLGTLPGAQNPLIDLLHSLYRGVNRHVLSGGMWFAFVSVLVLSLYDLRRSLAVMAAIIYFCGYVSIQFQTRHAFHLSFLAPWFLGLLLGVIVGGVVILSEHGLRRGLKSLLPTPQAGWRSALGRAAVLWSVMALLLLAGMWVPRAYQYQTVGGLLEQYAHAEFEPVQTAHAVVGDSLVIKPIQELAPESEPVPGFLTSSAGHNWILSKALRVFPFVEPLVENIAEALFRNWRVKSHYLMAEFSETTGFREVRLQFQPADSSTFYNCPVAVTTRSVSPERTVKYFFPVYEFQGPLMKEACTFEGIRLDARQASDFKGLYRVKNSRDFPFLLNLSLPGDISEFQRYLTLR